VLGAGGGRFHHVARDSCPTLGPERIKRGIVHQAVFVAVPQRIHGVRLGVIVGTGIANRQTHKVHRGVVQQFLGQGGDVDTRVGFTSDEEIPIGQFWELAGEEIYQGSSGCRRGELVCILAHLAFRLSLAVGITDPDGRFNDEQVSDFGPAPFKGNCRE